MEKYETVTPKKEVGARGELRRSPSVEKLISALEIGEKSGISEKTIEQIHEEVMRSFHCNSLRA
ncbi:hypothetical protein [Seleniivibrio woodruffii]|uniref:hypothetical protein n=1 Tax=Seleniivibrio woodruffii TaxID=1078050 RepID=UPI0010488060|nr:hypothetical protein [Seleniivibrio woodruffii]